MRPSRARRRQRIAALTAMAALLSACGGGGGGGDSPAPAPPSPPTSSTCAAPAPNPALGVNPGPVPSPPAPSGAFVIVGTATYDFVPTNSTGRGLDYAGTTPRPIRGATVQLLDGANNVLATTTTSETGSYGFGLPSAQPVRVRVRAEIRRSGSPNGDRNFTVLDNTASNALYVLDSAPLTPAAGSNTVNLNAASGWGGSSYTGTRSAGPFAILDVAYAAQTKVASADPTVTLAPLQLYWSPNNQPAVGSSGGPDFPAGLIGTSFFTSSGSTRSLYLLGAANTDTDEYDSHVVAHELGHYLQSALSRDDSPGGAHSTQDELDLRLAFSEGWGNAWSGMALGSPLYTDSQGSGQAAGFAINVGTPPGAGDRGAYSESSSQYLLWTLHQDPAVGFTPIYSSMRGLAAAPTFTTLYSFAAQLKTALASAAASITSLWAGQQIVAQDACGSGESNAGANASNLPVYKDYGATAGVVQNYCVNTSSDPDNDGNKLGRHVYVRFALSGARTITATRSGGSFTGASDPDLVLVRSDGSRSFANAETTPTQALVTTLPAGTHVLGLEDFNLEAPANTPATSCFNLTVN